MTALLRRLRYALTVLFALATLTFFLIRLAPGGPFESERDLPPETEAALRARFGLDRPLPVQYLRTMTGLLRADFGPSMKHRERQVRAIVADHLPPSILLGSIAIALALWLGVGAGILAGLHASTPLDYFGMALAVLGISLPAFVLGPLLQLVFAMRLGWLPVAGYGSPAQLVLPAATLALPFAARFARLARAATIDVMHEDYIRAARAKGLSVWRIVFRHALPGIVAPVLGFLGPAVATIVTGSLVVEKVFNIPGLGREFVEAAMNRDYTLVMGTTLTYGAFIVLCNMLADVLHVGLDPRLRA